MDSSVVCNLHLNTPISCLRGNDFDLSFCAIMPCDWNNFLSILGCVCNKEVQWNNNLCATENIKFTTKVMVVIFIDDISNRRLCTEHPILLDFRLIGGNELIQYQFKVYIWFECTMYSWILQVWTTSRSDTFNRYQQTVAIVNEFQTWEFSRYDRREDNSISFLNKAI